MTEINLSMKNLEFLSKKYQNILVGYKVYIDIINNNRNFNLYPIYTSIQSGKFGSLNDCQIWINSKMRPGYIRVSNQEVQDINFFNNWSIELPLHDYKTINKLLSLKAFW